MSSRFLFVTYPTPTTISRRRSITNRIGPLHDQDSPFTESGPDMDRSPNVARTLLSECPSPSQGRAGAVMCLTNKAPHFGSYPRWGPCRDSRVHT